MILFLHCCIDTLCKSFLKSVIFFDMLQVTETYGNLMQVGTNYLSAMGGIKNHQDPLEQQQNAAKPSRSHVVKARKLLESHMNFRKIEVAVSALLARPPSGCQLTE